MERKRILRYEQKPTGVSKDQTINILLREGEIDAKLGNPPLSKDRYYRKGYKIGIKKMRI